MTSNTGIVHPDWCKIAEIMQRPERAKAKSLQEQDRAGLLEHILQTDPLHAIQCLAMIEQASKLPFGQRHAALCGVDPKIRELAVTIAAYGVGMLLDEIERRFE